MKMIVELETLGDEVRLSFPKSVLEQLGMASNAKVEVLVEDGRIVAVPQRRPRYTLEELVAQCDLTAELTEEDREWLNDGPVGREVI